jgi:hypothetical protein
MTTKRRSTRALRLAWRLPKGTGGPQRRRRRRRAAQPVRQRAARARQ